MRRKDITRCLMLAIMALSLGFALAAPVQAQVETCVTSIVLSAPGAPVPIMVGDTITVRMTFYVLDVQGGTKATWNAAKFYMDCDTNFPIGYNLCTDETLKVGYKSGTISTNCPGITWSTAHTGGPSPNLITFTPTPALALLVGQNCYVQFDVEVLEKSTDNTPLFIQESGQGRAVCDSAAPASEIQQTMALPVRDCVVSLDKCVSVDGGVTCVGEGMKDGPPAVSIDSQPVDYKIVVSNPGDPAEGFLYLDTCTVTDPKLGVTQVIETLDPGASVPIDIPRFCDANTEGTNEAQVVCDSCGGRSGVMREDSDTVDLECQTPDVSITKECVRTDGTTFDFVVTVQNTGQTGLGCTVYDSVEPGVCPQTATAPEFTQALGVLPVGSPPVTHTFPSNTLEVASCNNAWVECTVLNNAGNPEPDSCVKGTCAFNGGSCSTNEDCSYKKIKESADDTCQPEGGWTRTPGFWCTHPDVIEDFGLLPVTVCGVELDTTLPGTQDSTSEALSIAIEGQINLQLARQCTATALNMASGGTVFHEYDFCCTNCETVPEIDGVNCIYALDMYNNSGDDVPAPFDGYASADPVYCQQAKKTKMTIFGVRDNNKGPDR